MDFNDTLFRALAALEIQTVEALICEGVDVNLHTDIGEGVWSYVAPQGVAAVKLALQFGADPNLSDVAGRDSLY